MSKYMLLYKGDTGTKLPAFRTLPCPMVGHQASWCRMLCNPIDGHGLCGRLAPHGLIGKTQRAIKDYRERNAGESSPCTSPEKE